MKSTLSALAATLLLIPSLQSFASHTSSGSLVIHAVIPPMMSLTPLPMNPSSNLTSGFALTRMRVAANHHFELTVASQGFAGETIKINGKKITLSAEGSGPVAHGNAGEQTIALIAPAGFGKKNRGGTIQLMMVYP